MKHTSRYRYGFVVARISERGEYGPANCHWRKAKNEFERKFGLEDLGFIEPEFIPLTRDEEMQRQSLTDKEKQMFDIWARIIWRAKHCHEFDS